MAVAFDGRPRTSGCVVERNGHAIGRGDECPPATLLRLGRCRRGVVLPVGEDGGRCRIATAVVEHARYAVDDPDRRRCSQENAVPVPLGTPTETGRGMFQPLWRASRQSHHGTYIIELRVWARRRTWVSRYAPQRSR